MKWRRRVDYFATKIVCVLESNLLLRPHISKYIYIVYQSSNSFNNTLFEPFVICTVFPFDAINSHFFWPEIACFRYLFVCLLASDSKKEMECFFFVHVKIMNYNYLIYWISSSIFHTISSIMRCFQHTN